MKLVNVEVQKSLVDGWQKREAISYALGGYHAAGPYEIQLVSSFSITGNRLYVEKKGTTLDIRTIEGDWDRLNTFMLRDGAAMRAVLTGIDGLTFTFDLLCTVPREWTDFERRQVGFDNQIPMGEDSLYLTFSVVAPSRVQTIDEELRRCQAELASLRRA